ncbi:MAG: hypothetical protein QOJ02_2835 [Acidobacteriota bacterium]|jgi:hypothetical protein|nr:hypothetical protein [Acidobacteriota bacterium]
MQICPKCGRTYENDTQKFCTHDGGRLEVDVPSAGVQAPTTYDLNQAALTDPYDPEATVTRLPDLNKTVISAPTSEIRSKDTGPAVAPPASPYQPPPPSSSQQQPTVAFNQEQPPPPQQQQQQQQQYYPQPPAQQPPPPAPAPPQSHQQQQQYAPAQQQQQYAAQPPATAARRKSSRLPLISGLVVILLAGGAAAWYFLIYKKGNAGANANSNVANSNANTNANVSANTNDNSNTTANANTASTPTPQPPPPNATQFVNTRANLDGKLAEKYSDFSFYYPNSWERDPKSGVAGASNFVRVERRLPPDFTQENFAVSWYDSQGTLEADQEKVFPKLVESMKAKLSKAYPEFKVLSEGGTTINALNGYELRFQSVSRGTEKGDITLWGWVVFLPPGKEGETNGLQLLMLTTSLAPELQSASDVGVKGELPTILNSFKMGSSN